MSKGKKKEVKEQEKDIKEEKKDIKEEKKDVSENKNSKKNIIIIVLSIAVVLLLCIVGWFIYRNSLEDKTTGSDWSDKYYEFLKEQSRAKKINDSLKEKSDISFAKTKSMEDPMMIVINDTKFDGKDAKSISVFGIVDDKVKYLTGQTGQVEEVKLYYDVEKKEYKYYIHAKHNEFDGFKSLDTVKYDYDNYNLQKEMEKKGITDFQSEEYSKLTLDLMNRQQADTAREDYNYYTEADKKVTETTSDGKELEYNKINEKLIDTDVKPDSFEYKKGMDVIKLRDNVIDGKESYKDLDELATKSIEKVVKQQIDLVEKIKQDIEKAKEEKQAAEDAKRAEEEKKAAEEAAKAGLRVGNYTLKYGKYIGSYALEGHVLILSPNGQCTYNGESCTYSIGTHDFAQDESTRGSYETCLIINGGFSPFLMPYSNTTIGDGDIGELNYAG